MTLLPHEPLPDGAVDRILTAVRHVPNRLNRDQLRADLEGVVSLYRASVDFRSAPAKQAKKADKIVAAARKLQSLIDDNWILRTRYNVPLKRLIADTQKGFPKEAATLLDVGRLSAFDNLVGSMLRKTYELHFNKKAGRSMNPISKALNGPFIRFAEAALAELGIVTDSGEPYSRNSIAVALKKGRNRRRV